MIAIAIAIHILITIAITSQWYNCNGYSDGDGDSDNDGDGGRLATERSYYAASAVNIKQRGASRPVLKAVMLYIGYPIHEKESL